jgi:conjugative transfer region lipoprotein (TIGR03751 family)
MSVRSFLSAAVTIRPPHKGDTGNVQNGFHSGPELCNAQRLLNLQRGNAAGGDNTMLELWNGADGGGSTSRQSAAARDTLRRLLTGSETQADAQTDRSYSRTQESEITQQFPRLPNPDMVMYLYPHLADGNTPVPGYSTVFPFYSQTQYAMPGERTEAL